MKLSRTLLLRLFWTNFLETAVNTALTRDTTKIPTEDLQQHTEFNIKIIRYKTGMDVTFCSDVANLLSLQKSTKRRY